MNSGAQKKVFVGMSGGVDSSVTALILKGQGYDVTGVFMKNWTEDINGVQCSWQRDLQDAKRVATRLNIPLKIYDFQEEYRQNVVDYMLEAFELGETPNPDIMCNQEIKFRVFLDASLADGADYIATGHYAGAKDGSLLTAKDSNKDQTYFLYRMPKGSLEKVLFPLQSLLKDEVRVLAQEAGFANATKKDSVGICFVGEVGLRDFLETYSNLKPGDIMDQDGNVVGRHDGAMLYTVGQRHGLGLTSGVPYYVSGKDIKKNLVHVTSKIHDPALMVSELTIGNVARLEEWQEGQSYLVRTRHRGSLLPVSIARDSADSRDIYKIYFHEPITAVAPGQSAVLYSEDGKICLGGGIVAA